jgi:nitrogen fixation NifU-like protein
VSDQGKVIDVSRILEEIQRQIMEQARAIYSPVVIEHAYNPRNMGRMGRPDAYKVAQGLCGDTMEMYLRLDMDETEEEIIREASFMTDGCGPSIACGSMLTSMVHGIPLEEAGKIEPEDLLAALGGLPEETAHCAYLAVDTLREAIAKWYRSAPTHEAENRMMGRNDHLPDHAPD